MVITDANDQQGQKAAVKVDGDVVRMISN